MFLVSVYLLKIKIILRSFIIIRIKIPNMFPGKNAFSQQLCTKSTKQM